VPTGDSAEKYELRAESALGLLRDSPGLEGRLLTPIGDTFSASLSRDVSAGGVKSGLDGGEYMEDLREAGIRASMRMSHWGRRRRGTHFLSWERFRKPDAAITSCRLILSLFVCVGALPVGTEKRVEEASMNMAEISGGVRSIEGLLARMVRRSDSEINSCWGWRDGELGGVGGGGAGGGLTSLSVSTLWKATATTSFGMEGGCSAMNWFRPEYFLGMDRSGSERVVMEVELGRDMFFGG
jgi:hypothetical protein